MSKKSGIARKLQAGILCALLIAMTVQLISQQIKFTEQEQQQQTLSAQAEELRWLNEQYTRQLKDADTLQTQERIARERLGLVKPGEILYLRQDPGDEPAPSATDNPAH